MFLPKKNNHRGSALLFVLMFGAVASIVIVSGLASYGLFEHKATLRKEQHDLAFHIAEAGINYYRWHLAHSPNDYTDGTGQPGPYVHAYTDKDGNDIGWYSLEIDPPTLNSTVVTIRSTGWTNVQPNTKRTIQVRLGYESITDYALLSNANMNVGFTTEIHGPIHSNGGIRFDGTSDSWVMSAKDTYQYENQTHNGVWGGGEPKSFWLFPVAPFDFSSITSDLATVRDRSDDGGIHLLSSGTEGWHIKFKSGATSTFDLYKVQTVDCYNGEGKYKGKTWFGTVYCYDIKTETFVQEYSLPENGVIFVEDHVWVEGVVDGYVTIAAARFPVQPSNYRNIYIPGNLTYKETASDDSLGLMTQGDIVVPHNVPEDMTIQAALLSQYGSLYRPYYDDDERDSLTVFGSQISYNGVAWKYVNGWGNVISGFVDTTHTYDANLTYYPPPGFPSGNTYSVVSWEELT